MRRLIGQVFLETKARKMINQENSRKELTTRFPHEEMQGRAIDVCSMGKKCCKKYKKPGKKRCKSCPKR